MPWYLNKCIYNLKSCYETSRQNKKKENLDIVKMLILLRLLLSSCDWKLLQESEIFC